MIVVSVARVVGNGENYQGVHLHHHPNNNNNSFINNNISNHCIEYLVARGVAKAIIIIINARIAMIIVIPTTTPPSKIASMPLAATPSTIPDQAGKNVRINPSILHYRDV